VYHDARWLPDRTEPELTRRTFETATPVDVRKRLEADARERREAGKRQPPDVLLIYAPADLAYGELLDFIGPALTYHNTVHIFLDAPAPEPEEPEAPEEPDSAE